jgi:hypothetical protein
MVTMATFITAFILIGMIFVGSVGINMVINSNRVKKQDGQARRPKQPHLHDIIFAQYNQVN